MKNLNKKNRIIEVMIFLLFITAGIFIYSQAAWAGPVDKAVTGVIGWVASIIVTVLGAIISVVIKAIIQIASYNKFINEQQIIEGWIIIRDLCNMFFILILLVVAFATILRVESYQWKKILPKLLIMAVLINFSKTICGLIIDFGQVVMLTFVNGFSDGGGNFVNTLGVQKYLNTVQSNTTWSVNSDFNLTSAAVGMLVAIIFLIIAGITMLAILAVLVMRIVMLWIYVILSPIAFLAAAFPAGQKYASQWWSEFSKQVIVGPVLAFFIWLALMASQSINFNLGAEGQSTCFGPAQIMCLNDFLNYIIAIGMLIGGLMVTQQMGGMAASIAGKGLDWAKKSPLLLGGGAMLAGGWLGRKIKSGAVSNLLATKEITQDEFGNKLVNWKGRAPGLGGIASALYGLETRPTKIIQGIREGLKSQAEKEEAQATGASAISLRRGGFGGLVKGLGVSRDLTEAIVGPGGFLWHKGFNRAWQATIKGGPAGVAKIEEELARLKAGKSITSQQYAEKKAEFDEYKKQNDENIKRAAQAGNMEEVNRLGVEQKKKKDELASLQSRIDGPGKIAEDNAAIEKLEKTLSSRKPIQTFYADRAREELISKASKTMGDNDNEEALVEIFNDALANGNKEVAQAVMLHAAKVGHLNEIIQSYKSKRDIHDENGRLLVKKGGYLPQGGYGLNEVVKQALIEDLGIDEHSALSTQSEASTLAKSVRHSNLTESVGSKNGFLFQRKIETPDGQLARARGESRKVDGERYLRDYNRLGWGDEFINASGGRDFKLNALGLDNFAEMADIINKEIKNRRFNKNAAMNVASDADTLRAWAKELEDNGMSYYDGETKKQESYVELAEKLIVYGNNIRQAQGKTEISKNIKGLQSKVLGKQARP